MKNASNFLARLIAVAALLGLGLAHSAKADNVDTFTSQVYYAGPSTDPSAPPDNPYGVVNTTPGNPIAGFALTSAGAQGTFTFDTNGNPGVQLVSTAPGLFTVDMYGAAASTMVNASGQLVTGTYTFNSSQDYFGIESAGGSTGFGCLSMQSCNTSGNPLDVTTINVVQGGIVTVSSSSLELVAAVTNTPTGAPEVDPKNAMVPLVLLAGAVLVFRGRRTKSVEVGV